MSCSMNCFECKFKDCINDEAPTLEEREEQRDLDIEHSQDGNVPRSTKYYRNNKDRCREHKRKYVSKNKEKVYERNRKYREEHMEEILAYNKSYYERNRDKFLEYQKSKYTPHPREVINTPQAEAHRNRNKEFYNRNKEEINRKRREKYRLRKEQEKCRLPLATTN